MRFVLCARVAAFAGFRSDLRDRTRMSAETSDLRALPHQPERKPTGMRPLAGGGPSGSKNFVLRGRRFRTMKIR
jgi:hypothetical protein